MAVVVPSGCANETHISKSTSIDSLQMSEKDNTSQSVVTLTMFICILLVIGWRFC